MVDYLKFSSTVKCFVSACLIYGFLNLKFVFFFFFPSCYLIQVGEFFP